MQDRFGDIQTMYIRPTRNTLSPSDMTVQIEGGIR